MANRTAKDAFTVKGTNPQYLVEKIIRMRIYDSRYWKEECFAISAELIVDKGMELRFIGGTYGGNIKPSPFLCLILKLLQIQPEKDIIIEFIRQEDSKYVRAIGAMYMRLTASGVEIFKYLEPLFNDYRKLRWMSREGKFEIIHMDEFIDKLLRDERVCDIQLPRLQKRQFLEEANELEPRISALEEDLDNLSAESSSDEEPEEPKKSKSKASPERRKSPERRRKSRSKSRERRRSRSRDRDRRHRDRTPEKSSKRDKDKDGDRSSKRDKDKKDDRKRTRESSYEREIREANELRATLNLAPLQY